MKPIKVAADMEIIFSREGREIGKASGHQTKPVGGLYSPGERLQVPYDPGLEDR